MKVNNALARSVLAGLFVLLMPSALVAADAGAVWDAYQRAWKQDRQWTKDKLDQLAREGRYQEMNAFNLPASPHRAEVTSRQDELLNMAKAGDKAAQYYVGAMHWDMALTFLEQGNTEIAQGAFRDAEESWRPLAAAGAPEAQRMLGSMYEKGYGVPKSPLNALEWYAKAAAGLAKRGEREQALVILDSMRALDRDHPLTKKLYRQLVETPKK